MISTSQKKGKFIYENFCCMLTLSIWNLPIMNAFLQKTPKKWNTFYKKGCFLLLIMLKYLRNRSVLWMVCFWVFGAKWVIGFQPNGHRPHISLLFVFLEFVGFCFCLHIWNQISIKGKKSSGHHWFWHWFCLDSWLWWVRFASLDAVLDMLEF